MTPRLVALDIDGTLLDVDQRISASVVDSVSAVLKAGAHVVLCTGRSTFGVLPVIDVLGLPGGYAVASNGAVTFDFPPARVVEAVTFDPGPAVEMVLSKVPTALVAVEVVGRGYRTNGRFPEGEITGEVWLESTEDLIKDPVTRVIIRDPESSAAAFMELSASLGLHGINYYVGHTAWLDLAPDGVSKASALADVAARLGVTRDEVLAIGDGRNDLEMLRWAGRGVAMGQAPDEVLAAADSMTAAWDEDGVAVELARWFDVPRRLEPPA